MQAEAAGERALEHTPRDIWAIHSMSHVHEETGMRVLVRLPSVIIIVMLLSGLEPEDSSLHIRVFFHITLPWPQDAGIHLDPPHTWVTLDVRPAA